MELRLRARLRQVRHPVPEPRRRLHAGARATRTRRRAASARCTRSFRRCCAQDGRVIDALRRDGRWLSADRPCAVRCRTWSISGWTRRPRSTRRAALPMARCKLERGYGDAVRQALADMGHGSKPPAPLGGAQAILIGSDGVLKGGSDPRKDGRAGLLRASGHRGVCACARSAACRVPISDPRAGHAWNAVDSDIHGCTLQQMNFHSNRKVMPTRQRRTWTGLWLDGLERMRGRREPAHRCQFN